MFNFIIYEDNNTIVKIYEDVIRKFINKKNCNYEIWIINKFNCDDLEKIINDISGKKIYLLDVEVPQKSGLEVARDIRESGDWTSQFIVISNFNKYSKIGITNRLLMLNFISKKNNVKKELNFSLNVAYNILRRQNSLVFQYNSEIFQILYTDICYIEKNLNNNDSTIVTKDNSKYIINKSINKLMEMFRDEKNFFKTHRSCIVNLDNITCFDIKRNIIKFKSSQVNLVSRNRRKELKNRLLNKINI